MREAGYLPKLFLSNSGKLKFQTHKGNKMKGFFVDTSNFSGKPDLFQVLNGKSRRLTFEGEKRNEIDMTWNIKNFDGISHAHSNAILSSIPEEFKDRFSRVPDPGSTSPTYKPTGEPREWGDYGDDD